MKCARVSVAMFLIACSAWLELPAQQTQQPSQRKPLTAIKQWAGRSRDSDGRRHAPKNSVVDSKTQWDKLWAAWKPGGPLPEVDFRRQLVLVGTAPGPNRVFLRALLDASGDVKLLVASTKIGGPGFGFAMILVERKGLKTVDGQPIGAAAVVTIGKEYVNVEIRGKLETGIVAIGGETTGVRILADGIAMELDLRSQPDLGKQLDQWNGKQVHVTGRLTVRQGVETGKRRVVMVKTLKVVDQQAPPPVKASQADDYLTPEGLLRQVVELKDAQGGFAGMSGHIWLVLQNGQWTRRPFLNRTKRSPDAQGQLTADELRALAGQLARCRVEKLPGRIGGASGANPHLVTIRYGRQQSTLVLGTGSSLPAANPASELDADRMVVLIRFLQKQLRADSAQK
ncbi:MAG: hypothetical protein ABGZ17_29145 [Planctomycetaceae bacterium]